jgi:hypothetical protein
MSQSNPYQPPQSNVASVLDSQEVDIDSLKVSDTWKKRFKWLKKAGGPSMPNAKNMTKKERREFSYFNILAFLFGPFYYLAKGMWRKAISLFIVCVVAAIILELLLEALGFEGLGKSVGYGLAAVFALRANIDYYKKMVLGNNGWW